MKKIAVLLLLFPMVLKSQNVLETEFLKQLNLYRDSSGLSQLEYDSNLSIAAKHLVDYKIIIYNKFGKKAFDTSGHYESIDLPGFQEIVTPSDRVNKFTNFKFSSEITTGSPGLILMLKRIDSMLANGFKLTKGDIRRDSVSVASTFFNNFKGSRDHNKALLINSEKDIKVGICVQQNVIVVVFGYKKN